MINRRHPFFNFCLAASVVAFGIGMIGCSGKTSSNKMIPPSPNNPVAKRYPLPPRASTDQMLLLAQETIAMRRSLGFMISRPSNPTKVGCIVFTPVGSGRTPRYLRGDYNCVESLTAGDTHDVVARMATGSEFFTYAGTFSQSTSSIKLKSVRKTVPVKTAEDMILTRNINAKAGTSTGGITDITVNFASSEEDVLSSQIFNSDFWQASSTGAWQTDGQTSIIGPQGTQFSLQYRPAKTGAAKAMVTSLSLISTTQVTFADGSCSYPMGTFNWTSKTGKTVASGTAVFSDQGIAVNRIAPTASSQTISWPADCIEN